MKTPDTYNKYLTDGIMSNEIPRYEHDGIPFYRVRKPDENETVLGNQSFSEVLINYRTPTEIARLAAEELTKDEG